MKKLLIATDGFFPRWDGIVRFLKEMVPRLKSDFEITIVAPRFSGRFHNHLGVDVHRFDLLNILFGDISFAKVTAGRLRKFVEDADIVFVQSLGTIGIAAIVAARKKRIPVVAYLHLIEWELAMRSLDIRRGFVEYIVRKVSRRYYNMCDLLICPSEEMMYKYEKNRIITPKTVVYLGCDVDEFYPAKDKDAAKQAIGIDKDDLVIGFHGRIAREKDLVTLYRAFRKLEKKYPKIKLLIVGKGVKNLENMFSSGRNIITPGSQDDVVPFLHAMDIYVLPSLTETTSLSTLEAMSCGLAVVATPCGNVKDYIIERENGMLFPFRNSQRLYMKLRLLAEDPKLRNMLGKNARKTVVEKFNWNSTYSGISEQLKKF